MDNSETIRRIVMDCVLDLGFNFFEASNGKDGLERIKELPDLGLVIFNLN